MCSGRRRASTRTPMQPTPSKPVLIAPSPAKSSTKSKSRSTSPTCWINLRSATFAMAAGAARPGPRGLPPCPGSGRPEPCFARAWQMADAAGEAALALWRPGALPAARTRLTPRRLRWVAGRSGRVASGRMGSGRVVRVGRSDSERAGRRAVATRMAGQAGETTHEAGVHAPRHSGPRMRRALLVGALAALQPCWLSLARLARSLACAWFGSLARTPKPSGARPACATRSPAEPRRAPPQAGVASSRPASGVRPRLS